MLTLFIVCHYEPGFLMVYIRTREKVDRQKFVTKYVRQTGY